MPKDIKEYIETQVQSIIFQKNDEVVAADQDHCSICVQDFEDGESLKMLDCAKDEENSPSKVEVRHIFHQQCISKWFEKKKECPLCR